MGERLVGKVKLFLVKEDKRYGFIPSPEGGKDIFFHFEDGRTFVQRDGEAVAAWSEARVQRDPKQGDLLIYEVESRKKGMRAAVWGFADDAKSIEERMNPKPVLTEA